MVVHEMNKRTRKKWLKKHNKYVNPRECWNLDKRIAEFVLPRLKIYKKEANCYPGRDEANTPEKWDAILDKMISAFEYILEDEEYWLKNYNYTQEQYKEKWIEKQESVSEGLHLFAEYFRDLWW